MTQASGGQKNQGRAVLWIVLIMLLLTFYPTKPTIAASINLPQTGQTKCFDSSGTEIGCSGSGQDGEIRAGVTWPNPRFVDNGDGTLTDKLTGLMWLKDANCFGSQSWFTSLEIIADLNIHSSSYNCIDYTATYSDWRLPNINEIESLINPEAPNPSVWLINQGFANVQYNWYWSSTTRAYTPAKDSAWVISMMVGWVNTNSKNSADFYVWPVRQGQFGNVDNTYPANLWKTGQTTTYYPGDDGEHQAGVSPPSIRFSDNGDGTVSDNLTGLQWTKKANTPVVDACPVGTMTWQQALDLVACLNTNNYLGHSDWRVPNRKELFSLTDYSQFYTALPSGHPFVDTAINPNSLYWASTSSGAYGNALAWLSQIKNEGGIAGDYKTNQYGYPYQVWPVRDGRLQTPFAAPLHNEDALLMTTSSYSNFATREYFNVLKINHSGTDLALSPDGTHTASTATTDKPVYPICDGEVEFVYSKGGLYSFVKVRHHMCSGQDVVAYYGHLTPNNGITTVTPNQSIGTVKDWSKNSHLHLTIDTNMERDLSRINYVACNYSLDANSNVVSLTSCNNDQKLTNGRMLLKIGWGQIKTVKYRNENGRLYTKNLYITENAIRQLGFISFFDIYQK